MLAERSGTQIAETRSQRGSAPDCAIGASGTPRPHSPPPSPPKGGRRGGEVVGPGDPPPVRPMRQAMPTVAAWVDGLRQVFGADGINGRMKQGMAGEPVFYACENGRELGMKGPDVGWVVPVLPLPVQPEIRARKRGAQ